MYFWLLIKENKGVTWQPGVLNSHLATILWTPELPPQWLGDELSGLPQTDHTHLHMVLLGNRWSLNFHNYSRKVCRIVAKKGNCSKNRYLYVCMCVHMYIFHKFISWMTVDRKIYNQIELLQLNVTMKQNKFNFII